MAEESYWRNRSRRNFARSATSLKASSNASALFRSSTPSSEAVLGSARCDHGLEAVGVIRRTCGVKLLVLGESAHATEYPVGATPESFLVDTVRQFLDNDEKWRFYRILTCLLANTVARELTEKARRDVWASGAFFSFVPGIAAEFSRRRPPPKMFEDGKEPFLTFLRDKKPEAILVCGCDTWYWALKSVGFEREETWALSSYHFEHIPMISSSVWRPQLQCFATHFENAFEAASKVERTDSSRPKGINYLARSAGPGHRTKLLRRLYGASWKMSYL
jgi:hypothetical protein